MNMSHFLGLGLAAAWLAACPRSPAPATPEYTVLPPGSDETNIVKAMVKLHTGQFLYCYEQVLKSDPAVEGRVEVGWTVSGGAVVGTPHIIVNTTGNADLADCIVRKISGWEFPPEVEGDMSWPFHFVPR